MSPVQAQTTVVLIYLLKTGLHCPAQQTKWTRQAGDPVLKGLD